MDKQVSEPPCYYNIHVLYGAVICIIECSSSLHNTISESETCGWGSGGGGGMGVWGALARQQ